VKNGLLLIWDIRKCQKNPGKKEISLNFQLMTYLIHLIGYPKELLMLLKIKDNVVLAGHFQQWMDLKDYTLIKKARYYRSLNNR